jgi:hypothetical protein
MGFVRRRGGILRRAGNAKKRGRPICATEADAAAQCTSGVARPLRFFTIPKKQASGTRNALFRSVAGLREIVRQTWEMPRVVPLDPTALHENMLLVRRTTYSNDASRCNKSVAFVPNANGTAIAHTDYARRAPETSGGPRIVRSVDTCTGARCVRSTTRVVLVRRGAEAGAMLGSTTSSRVAQRLHSGAVTSDAASPTTGNSALWTAAE